MIILLQYKGTLKKHLFEFLLTTLTTSYPLYLELPDPRRFHTLLTLCVVFTACVIIVNLRGVFLELVFVMVGAAAVPSDTECAATGFLFL